MLANLTSNQYYRGLNRRFDRRAKRLRQLGFVYRDGGMGFAVFSRMKGANPKFHTHIPACLLSSADNRRFYDAVVSACRY